MIEAETFGCGNLITEFRMFFVHVKKSFHICLKRVLYAGTDKTGRFSAVDPVHDGIAARIRFGFAEKSAFFSGVFRFEVLELAIHFFEMTFVQCL